MNDATNASAATTLPTSTTVGSIVRIGRRAFAVSHIDPTADRGRPMYFLAGVRGASYATMRNVNRPHMMFLVNNRGFGIATAFHGTWLSDKTGALEVMA